MDTSIAEPKQESHPAITPIPLMLMATAVEPHLPYEYLNPFRDFVWPAYVRGDLAFNKSSYFGGLPIAGDPVYGRRGRDRAEPGLDRPALHARVLGLVHPNSGERMRFAAELPPDLSARIAALARREQASRSEPVRSEGDRGGS